MKARSILTTVAAILGCTIITGCAARQTMTYREFLEHVNKIKENNEKACVPGCIAFEGDSNFELINVQKYFSMPACNYAFRGSMTVDLLKRKERLQALKPSIIVLLVGANDLVRGRPLNEINENYLELMQYYKTFCEKIYFISNLPVHPAIFIKNSTLVELNSLLADSCKKSGVVFVSVYPGLVKNGGLNPDYALDQVHLNRAGQDVLMNILKKELREREGTAAPQ